MQQFTHVITDPVGIHARPASLLAKEVATYESEVIITLGEKSANAKKLIAIMGLGAKENSEITITVEGSDEVEATAKLKEFLTTM